MFKKVMVIGAGTMGSGIAQVFAEHGVDVVLNDIKQEFIDGGMKKIDKQLTKKVSKGKITEDQKAEILGHFEGIVEITEENMKDVELVVEAAIEDYKIKSQILKNLDEKCPANTILASNTSSLPITKIATATNRPDKVIGMHFFNPVPSMKLVEIIRGANTTQETFDFIYNLTKEIGKDPVEVAEAPGFVVNKILIPMVNEAIDLVETGVASVADIDKAMMLGANHPMGPWLWATSLAWTCAWPSWRPCTSRPAIPSTVPHCCCARWSAAACWARRPARASTTIKM